MIRDTIDLEPAEAAGFILQIPVRSDTQIATFVWERILHSVPLAVAEISNLEVGCQDILCSRHENSSQGDPAAVQRARDVEDSAFAALRIVNDPALVLALVVRSRGADGDESAAVRIRKWVCESKAIHFKGQVTALGQIADYLLKPILKEERVF